MLSGMLGYAGVGKAGVQATELRERVGKYSLDHRLVADVAAKAEHAAAFAGQLRDRLIGLVLIRSPDRDLGAGLQQRLRHAQANAAVAAGDECFASAEIEGLVHGWSTGSGLAGVGAGWQRSPR